MMDKLLNAMKLNEMDEDYDVEDYYEEDEPVEKPKKVVMEDIEEEEISSRKKNQSKVTPIRQVKRAPGNGMEVCVIKPTTVEEAREITETLLDNRTVILNLESIDVEIAQRIIDNF